MSNSAPARLTVFDGPSVHAPFPAVLATFQDPDVPPLPEEQVANGLRGLLPQGLLQHLALPLRNGEFETVVAALALALLDWNGPSGIEPSVERDDDGRVRIVLGYYDAAATVLALQVGLDLAMGVFTELAGQPVDRPGLTARVQWAASQVSARQPDPLARPLLQAARRRGIPLQPLAPGSRVWMLGQGAAGVQVLEAASHKDAFIGARLARNKVGSNQLVTRLGFPGVRHAVAGSPDTARQIAREIGYPVVIKPNDAGKGAGVTPYLLTDEEIPAAFAAARAASPGAVLVEKHVAGDDHRMCVFGGRLAWVVRRSPPRVQGDGEHSIAQLVELENERRAALPAGEFTQERLTIDAGMQALLAAQGLRPTDVPPAGREVTLRRAANVALGGVLTDCTASVHPDNRDLAESIARAFHLDAAGLDFITPDIGRSWREIDCAVVEVNGTPGYSKDSRAEIILDAQFPAGADGRLPAIVLVGADAAALTAVAAAVTAQGLRTGCTSGDDTRLGDRPRSAEAVNLPQRVQALTLDPGCEALVIGVTPEQLERHGFPLERCELALVAADATLAPALGQLVTACAATVAELPAGGADAATLARVQAAVRQRRGPAV